jgi:hypothetical protein
VPCYLDVPEFSLPMARQGMSLWTVGPCLARRRGKKCFSFMSARCDRVSFHRSVRFPYRLGGKVSSAISATAPKAIQVP